MGRIKVCVKQGEDILIGFKIKQDGSPLDLSTYDNITVIVKKAPYVTVPPMFEKVITTASDLATVGQITSPTDGEVRVRFTEEDTSYHVGEYAFIMVLNGNGSKDIISSDCNNEGVYIVDNQ